MRNREPFEDVVIYWKRCAVSRLKELLQALTPTQYIDKWKGILKMPKAKKLVSLQIYLSSILFTYKNVTSLCFYLQILDDFEVLPDVDPSYECLRGKKNNLLEKWPSFVDCVQKIVDNDSISGLSLKDKQRFQSLMKDATSESECPLTIVDF